MARAGGSKRERKGKQVAEAEVHTGPQTWTDKEIVALSQTWCATSKKQCLWEWCEGGRLLGKWYGEYFVFHYLRYLEYFVTHNVTLISM